MMLLTGGRLALGWRHGLHLRRGGRCDQKRDKNSEKHCGLSHGGHSSRAALSLNRLASGPLPGTFPRPPGL